MAKSPPAVTEHQGEVEVVVLIKAAPEIGRKHGETVCVAGVDAYGKWHRLYPVPFKDLVAEQRFTRWDRIRVRWRRPSDDDRIESKRIDPVSLRIVSKVIGDERAEVADRALVPSIEEEAAKGRSLALIRPANVKFLARKLNARQLAKSARRRSELVSQNDLFGSSVIPDEPPPYEFSYRFEHGGRNRHHVCIDWETEWTFFKWRRQYGEERALRMIKDRWGEAMPRGGLVFAMGTHRVKMFNTWLLSGVIQASIPQQSSLSL